MRKNVLLSGLAVAGVLLGVPRAEAVDLRYKDRLLADLVEKVPEILKSFDPETGRFGSGIWICRDQHPMYPLAVAYATKGEGNPYHEDPELLKVIIRAGDPLLEKMDEQGRWIFKKKDGSTWGMIWMPWTYSRWIRTFALVHDDMPPDARRAWTKALTLGYTGISKHNLGSVHNIPTHHAMGLYIAGKVLGRPEWCEQAAKFMIQVIGTQSEGGYWSEGGGPVVLYDFVYVDALGTYYATSGDERVLPSLEKAAAFHRHFTYPDGRNVETIDQRNPYHDRVEAGNVGFTFSPGGRAFLKNQWSHLGLGNLAPDLIASLLLYGQEGPIEEPPADDKEQLFVLTEGSTDRAATLRHGPWFVCLSAYTTPIIKSRWIQDRQNFLSIYHQKTGLILGGGNTKLQPAWSSFTVGDTALLAHTPGDENPDFLPKGELYHVPSATKLVLEPDVGLDLTYGPETCRIRVRPVDERTLQLILQTTAVSDLPVAAHLTLIPHLGQPLETAAGEKPTLADAPLHLSPEQIGGWLAHGARRRSADLAETRPQVSPVRGQETRAQRGAHGGYRLHVPACASLHWPALPHNPYRKDGRATRSEGRLEVRIPLPQDAPDCEVTVEVLP